LMLRPKVIVCDEVVAALDVSIRGDILNLFADLQREFNLTYVFITHDIAVVSHISDRIAVTYLGRLMELGAAADVIERPLHPYTQALLSAEPVPLPSTMRTNRRIVLEGETLGEAVLQFNRFNVRKLVIADPSLAAEKLVGQFRATEPLTFARAVATTLGARIDEDRDTIRLSRPDRQ